MTRYQFIFTKEFPERIYRHIAFWVIYYLFSLITYFHPLLERTTVSKWLVVEVVEVFWHVFTEMIFCYAVIYYLLPVYFIARKYAAFVAWLAALSVITYVLGFWQQSIFFSRIHHFAGIPFLAPVLLYWYTFISFVSYYPISTGLAIAFKTLKNFYIKQAENQLLISENANAELQLLKAQIHPHFLFNTLNNIYSFSLNHDVQAPKLVMNLSDTLQYMITECDAGVVPLSKELKMIHDYVDLERVRYGDRLEIKVDIQGDVENKAIAPLLMIPFIENSFKHGASKMMGNVWISLFIQADASMLHFTLVNSKSYGSSAKEMGGIGLNNVKKRLQLLYPRNHFLKIDAGSNTFTVNMQIPLQEMSLTATPPETKSFNLYA